MPNSPEIQFAKEALEQGESVFFDNNRFSGCCQKDTETDKLFFMHSRKNSLNAHMTLTWSQSTAK
jgi:hypothetical protein